MVCPGCYRILPDHTPQCPGCGSRIPDSELPTQDLADKNAGPASAGPTRSDLAPGSLFAARFTIVEKIGEGGMGMVYKALDNQLDLPVALKMIRPALARQAGAIQRFKDEVRIARQITHRCVSRVHDLGEFEGQYYLSMEWIQGETLRQLLKRAGALDQDRVVKLAADIASALEAAHAHGIIHRDLKPENIMIDESGGVHVMDFGIAVLEEAQVATRAAGPFGTPGYMAPEQRRGEPVDGRADLYALGVIMVEMLVGRPVVEPLKALGQARTVSSKVLYSEIEGLLQEDRRKRPASATAVAELLGMMRNAVYERHLGKPLTIILVIVAVAAGLVFLTVRILRPHPQSRPAALVEATRVPVTASPASTSPADVFYLRGLDYLLNKSESTQGLESAINMLHRAVEEDPRKAPAWAALGEAFWRRFERNGEGSSRDEAADAVDRAFAIDANLPEAANARGVGLFAMGKYDEAQREFRKAVTANPSFDVAWANLGVALQQIDGGYADGLKALQKAIALNPSYFRHYVYLGLFHEHFSEWAEAMIAYKKATDLKPDSFASWNNLGGVLLRLRNGNDAAKAFERSLTIQDTAEGRTNLGNALYYSKRYQEAAEQYRRATAISPRGAVYWKNLGDAETMLGRGREARMAYVRALDLARERVVATPLDPQSHRQLALLCAKTGDTECALKEGSRATTLAPGDASIAFANAVIRCLLGKADEALDHLEHAVHLGLTREDIENDPDLRPLHSLPRYRRIVELAG